MQFYQNQLSDDQYRLVLVNRAKLFEGQMVVFAYGSMLMYTHPYRKKPLVWGASDDDDKSDMMVDSILMIKAYYPRVISHYATDFMSDCSIVIYDKDKKLNGFGDAIVIDQLSFTDAEGDDVGFNYVEGSFSNSGNLYTKGVYHEHVKIVLDTGFKRIADANRLWDIYDRIK